MEVGLFQWMVWPPHCRARSRETMEPRNIRVPRGSRCLSLEARGRERFLVFVEGETGTKRIIARRIAKPMGTLLCVISIYEISLAYFGRTSRNTILSHISTFPSTHLVY
jgi:hypothetical protein